LHAHVMDVNGLDTWDTACWVLLKYWMDSKCVPEMMWRFRSTQCCVFRKSTAPKVLRQVPCFFIYDCLVVMWNTFWKIKIKVLHIPDLHRNTQILGYAINM
jgi:hypothetical protein